MSDQISDTRTEWDEKKKANISKIELEMEDLNHRIYAALNRRTFFATSTMTDKVNAVHLQVIVTASEIAGLVDTLEAMGKIDRVDFGARCVGRLRKLLSTLEQAN
jgi:hypothetical protein